MATKSIEIYGVVDSGGGGGAIAGKDRYRTTQFVAWRAIGGEISKTRLYVKEKCKEEDTRRWMKSINAGCMLHMKIKFTKQMTPEQLRGEVIEYFGKTRVDKELLEAAKDKRAKSLKVASLGQLKLDAEQDCYCGSVQAGRGKIELQINSTDPAEIDALADRIKAAGIFKPSYVKAALDALVSGLIDLKNETWLEPDQKPVSQAAFRKAVTLDAIHIWPDDSFEFLYEDGELFHGHDLVVRGTLQSGPSGADLYG